MPDWYDGCFSRRIGNQTVHGTFDMPKPEEIIQSLQSIGVIYRVDMVNRELTVLVNGELKTFDVPVGCHIALHGERVKLRVLQPWDRVKVRHIQRGGLLVALRVEAQPVELTLRASGSR